MIFGRGKGRGRSKEQAHGGADDRAAETTGGRTESEYVAREVGVSKHTIYAWKAKYGGMDVSERRKRSSWRMKTRKLKKLVVDLSLDKEMLKA